MMIVGSQIPCHIALPLAAAMHVVSRDVIEYVSQAGVIFPCFANSEGTRPKALSLHHSFLLGTPTGM
jgi:hypothetical protein